MPKPVEQHVSETLGAQVLTILRLTSENELLHARIKEVEAERDAALAACEDALAAGRGCADVADSLLKGPPRG